MLILIVVSNPRDWPLDIPGVSVVTARDYLTDPDYGDMHAARVFNLCKSYRYQSLGYYVSLLAEARGHRPLPNVNAIEDLQSWTLVRLLAQGVDDLLQRSMASVNQDKYELGIYFGHSIDRHYAKLSLRLYNLLQAPLLSVHLERHHQQWQIRSVRPIAASEIPLQHREFVVRAATEFFSGHPRRERKHAVPLYEIAILHDPDNPEPASNARALRKFVIAAKAQGMRAELITRADWDRLSRFDALFIRDTTFVNHYTYRFSRLAAAEGLVVIDDPPSILKCNNKVYLTELLQRHGIPIPGTLLVHRDNPDRIMAELGLPCVLKQPDSSFSLGVVKIESEAELRVKVRELLEKSELIVAQEYLPTEFDWRVGILDRHPLFACKYFMVPGHWQIIRHEEAGGKYREGPTQAYDLNDVPQKVVKLALKAANLIGDGFYGVDIKQVGKRCYVIEVNDNPNVDAGNEDGVLKDSLYDEIMASFARRIEKQKRRFAGS